MVALDDQQDLALPEGVDLLIGPADVREHGEPIALLVKQDRIVRGGKLPGIAADEDAPGVLADQLRDDLGILAQVVWVVAHLTILPAATVTQCSRAETI